LSGVTQEMINRGYGYRTGGHGFATLKDLLHTEVLELRNFHVIRELCDVIGVKKYKGAIIDEMFSEDALLNGAPVDPFILDDISDIAETKFGKGKVVWLGTKKNVRTFYQRITDGILKKYVIPEDARVISDLGCEGALFYYPTLNGAPEDEYLSKIMPFSDL